VSEEPHTIVDWAVATLALEGEYESGDLHVVAPFLSLINNSETTSPY
jgi:hypothetical protein